MCGIERQCAACKKWKAPSQFRREVLRGIYFDKRCKWCRGERKEAA